ncbi:hypothetical protein ACLOJK_027546 [Asimina triloba]
MYLPRLIRYYKVNLKGGTPSKMSSYDYIKEATLKRMRYRKDDHGHWIYKDDIQGSSSQTSQEPSHPSAPQADVNVEDFLMDPEANIGGAGPSSGKIGDTDDVANTGRNESTQPVSPGSVPFSTPSTTISRPTMSFGSMPSSSPFHGVIGSSGS